MDYYLMLESGRFVDYEQISENEVEVNEVGIEFAHEFSSLTEAREAAVHVNSRKDGDFILYSSQDVVRVVQSFSLK